MLTAITAGSTTCNFAYGDFALRSAVKVGSATLIAYSYEYRANSLKTLAYGNGDSVQYTYDQLGRVTAQTRHDAGNILSATGTLADTLGEYNPLRYRGYVYDTETGFYYLQSRYYDPEIGRFINSDCYGATGQGLLGNNPFVYCANNPTNCIDVDGHKVVGIGVQVELQLGDVSIGVEFILYFDKTVCGGEDFLLVMYTYSGYEIPIQELSSFTNKVEALLLAYLTEHAEFSEDVFIGAVDTFLSGIGASGGAFWIDGKEDFVSPDNYSGTFETISLSFEINKTSVTGFHSYSDKCDVYGVKVGKKFLG